MTTLLNLQRLITIKLVEGLSDGTARDLSFVDIDPFGKPRVSTETVATFIRQFDGIGQGGIRERNR